MLFLSVKKNISKSFGDLQVLKEIGFDIHKGKRLQSLVPAVLVNPTILRCINQLETYDSGEIDYMGKPVNSGQALHELRQHIGMVFQRFNVFYPYECAAECDRGTGSCEKSSQTGGNCKGKRFAENGWAGRQGKRQWQKNLSGGQQQRVAIARAMAMNPEVILF